MARRTLRRLITVLRLPARDRTLLMCALLLVALVRLALTLLPFRAVRRLLSPLLRTRAAAGTDVARQADRICWAVTVAARHVPVATCLTQALAAQILLTRAGIRCRLQIGGRRDAAGAFVAHAWVVCADRVVIGGRGHESFTPLFAWTGDRWQEIT